MLVIEVGKKGFCEKGYARKLKQKAGKGKKQGKKEMDRQRSVCLSMDNVAADMCLCISAGVKKGLACRRSSNPRRKVKTSVVGLLRDVSLDT